MLKHCTQVLVRAKQRGVPVGQSMLERQSTHRPLVGLQNAPPPQSVFVKHSAQMPSVVLHVVPPLHWLLSVHAGWHV